MHVSAYLTGLEQTVELSQELATLDASQERAVWVKQVLIATTAMKTPHGILTEIAYA